MFPDFTEDSEEMIPQLLNQVATIPSLVGSLIMCYFCLRSMSTNIFIKLILALAASDFFFSAVNMLLILSPEDQTPLCTAIGFFRDFFTKLSMCLVTSIAILHYKVIIGDQDFNKDRFVSLSIIFGILISLIFTLRYSFVQSY